MTIFAGIVTRRDGMTISDAECLALRNAISRYPGDTPQVHRDRRTFFAKVDIGALDGPAWSVRPDGTFAMLAGRPLLALDRETPRRRAEDLAELHAAWSLGDDTAAARARGTFAAAHYDPATHRLTLATDKLGVRPIYYWIDADRVVFATALRILEALAFVPKVADFRGMTELACLGTPLGARTPYAGIRILRSGEVVRISDTGVTHAQYWRWDRIAPSRRPETQLAQAARDQFAAAVGRRLGDGRSAAAFLSGGLDSRAVVAALRNRGARVDTFNFSLPGTQDRVFAAGFARAAGTDHHEAAMTPEVELRFSTMLSAALLAGPAGPSSFGDRPRVVWSGEGGSMGAGHIYVDQAMVDTLRAGRRDAAITMYLDRQKAYVLDRLLQPKISAALVDAPREGIAEELADVHPADPGREMYLFLLLNDQRRHLATHFEDLDRDRLEFETPFYDSDFLTAMIEAPIDLCLYHRLYMKWLALLSPTAVSVPWQYYPGHVPCPLPIPEGLHYQWKPGGAPAFNAPRRRQLLRAAREMLRAPGFPDDALRKGTIRLASWVSRIRPGTYEYILRQADLYYRYCSRAGGRWTLTEAHGD